MQKIIPKMLLNFSEITLFLLFSAVNSYVAFYAAEKGRAEVSQRRI